jgi:hypothetical protein
MADVDQVIERKCRTWQMLTVICLIYYRLIDFDVSRCLRPNQVSTIRGEEVPLIDR